jgi:hypothetical protein
VSIDSYFQVLPQYKSRSKGELVYSEDPIYLKCCGGSGDFFLRSSNKFKIQDDADYEFLDLAGQSSQSERSSRRGSSAHFLLGKTHKWSSPREVNASNNPSTWTFNIYSQYNTKLSSYLSTVSPFRIRHPETDCYLSHTIVTKKAGASLR